MAGDYTVKIVEQDGTVVVSNLANVNVEPITETLNDGVKSGFTFPKASSDAGSVDLLDREAQIFRDGSLLHWGPMISGVAESGEADVSVTVPDCAWYFTRRQISDRRPNALGNPSFESGLTGWTPNGVTATQDSTRHALGSYALKLVQANAGVDTFAYQQVAVTGTAIGTLYTLAGWVYVQNSGYVGPAYESRGLRVDGIEAGVVRISGTAEIDDDTPRDRWERLETTIWVPPNETWTLEVRCYAPGGTVWWDALQLVAMDSLSFYATDMGTIAGNIVNFIQNPTYGWDDLNIDVSNPATGVLLDRHYQFADHTDVMMALDEFENMGQDWWIAITTTTRTFTTAYPRGTDRSGSVSWTMRDPVSNPTGTLSWYRLTKDGSQTETRVTVMGEGDGPDREEGYAADALDLGGLVLGGVYNATPGAPIDALQREADARLADSKGLVSVLEVKGIPGDTTQISTVKVGDTVTVTITDGWTSVTGGWRVVSKTIDPASDTASFVLNETATSIIYDGGSAAATGADTYDGGTASTSHVNVLDGGTP